MEFEHRIQVTLLEQTLPGSFKKENIWAALMHRAHSPKPFLPGLENYSIRTLNQEMLERTLDFGSAQIEDTVQWVELEWVRFTIKPSEQQAGGILTIRLEEPTSGDFFLHFHYTLPLSQEDEAFAGYLKSAYVQTDTDTVNIIQKLLNTLAI